jgi:hypothetical protein
MSQQELTKSVGESKDLDDDRGRGLQLDKFFFPESSSILDFNEVFQMVQKLALNLAFKNYLD